MPILNLASEVNLFFSLPRWQKIKFYGEDRFTLSFALEDKIYNHLNFGNESFAYLMLRIPPSLFLKSIQSEKISPEDIDAVTELLDDNIYVFGFGWDIFIGKKFMSETVDAFILKSLQHGIVNYYERKYHADAPKVIEDPRRILTMHMLSAGWYLWLGGIVLAFIVFIFEHIVRWKTRRSPKYKLMLRTKLKTKRESFWLRYEKKLRMKENK